MSVGALDGRNDSCSEPVAGTMLNGKRGELNRKDLRVVFL